MENISNPTLRCRPGQMAIIVKSDAGNIGRIVTCIKFIGQLDGGRFVHHDLWEIDQKINVLDFSARSSKVLVNESSYCPDSHLQPLSDLDEDYESVRALEYETA